MAGGTLDLRVDLVGYVVPGAEKNFYALKSTQVFDSSATSAVQPGETRNFALGGTSGIPINGVEGAILTVTALNFSSDGNLKIFGGGFDEPAPAFLRFSSAESGNGGATVTSIVRPGFNGEVSIANTSSTSSVNVRISVSGWFASPRAVPASEEGDFIAGAVSAGIDPSVAHYAVFNEEIASAIPVDVQIEEMETSIAGEQNWAATSNLEPISDTEYAANVGTNPSTISASADNSDPSDLAARDASSGRCSGDGYKLGRYGFRAKYYDKHEHLLWSTKFQKRWCYNSGRHVVSSDVYWNLEKPEFTTLGSLAWNHVDNDAVKHRYKKYNGYDRGAHWTYQRQNNEHCAFIGITACIDVYDKYWIQGHYDGSKIAGGTW